jgi:hypothetical protein
MRVTLGVILGVLLFFPGIVLLQWISNSLGLYDELSVTDGCLVMIVILLAVFLMRANSSEAEGDTILRGSSSRDARARRPKGRTER